MTGRTDDMPNLTQVLVQFIAHNRGMARRLLAQHVADRNGYCTGCTCAQAGWHVAPCTIAIIARRAHNRERAIDDAGPRPGRLSRR